MRSFANCKLYFVGEVIQNKILSSLIYKKATRIAIYLSLTKEVGTRAIIEDILRTGSPLSLQPLKTQNTVFRPLSLNLFSAKLKYLLRFRKDVFCT
jgi:5-formyltetrahydrofolate cyclo-ligase